MAQQVSTHDFTKQRRALEAFGIIDIYPPTHWDDDYDPMTVWSEGHEVILDLVTTSQELTLAQLVELAKALDVDPTKFKYRYEFGICSLYLTIPV